MKSVQKLQTALRFSWKRCKRYSSHDPINSNFPTTTVSHFVDMPKPAVISVQGQTLCTDTHLQPQRTNMFVDNSDSDFVPPNPGLKNDDVERLQNFVDTSHRMMVITGAGLSTESGIPDYRSEGVGLYARRNHRPMNYQEFLQSDESRQRYWARNFTGWPIYSRFQPNISHVTLSKWEKSNQLHWLVTQNVDALHVKAGSVDLTELHGSLYRVMCLSCKHKLSRSEFQRDLEKLNVNWKTEAVEIAPDGDVQLTDEQVQGFQVPPCKKCGGVLKPDIVFFGDNVAREKVEFVYEKLKQCDSLLVLGSSLQVYSAYRFVLRARDLNVPICVVNIGPTRADPIIDLKINSLCSDIIRLITLS